MVIFQWSMANFLGLRPAMLAVSLLIVLRLIWRWGLKNYAGALA